MLRIDMPRTLSQLLFTTIAALTYLITVSLASAQEFDYIATASAPKGIDEEHNGWDGKVFPGLEISLRTTGYPILVLVDVPHVVCEGDRVARFAVQVDGSAPLNGGSPLGDSNVAGTYPDTVEAKHLPTFVHFSTILHLPKGDHSIKLLWQGYGGKGGKIVCASNHRSATMTAIELPDPAHTRKLMSDLEVFAKSYGDSITVLKAEFQTLSTRIDNDKLRQTLKTELRAELREELLRDLRAELLKDTELKNRPKVPDK